MQKFGRQLYVVALLVAALFSVSFQPDVLAVTSKSSNYQVSETKFGSGGTIGSCSDKYCATASIGDVVAGSSEGTTSTAKFGKIAKDSEPLLEVIVEQGPSDLGVLSLEETSTKTISVKIRTYMSDGYTLQIIGEPPKYQDHSLSTLDDPAASKTGSEQFGLNLVANSTPEVGSDPVQTPSGEFSFGVVEPDYADADLFKYQSGAVVARSSSESGQTDYTISMIINVSNSTPAGHFAGDYQAFVMPAF